MTVIPIGQPATLDSALAALAEVVQDRIARGRSTRSAGIKSVLASKFGGTFDQHAYGFDTFRRFLEEAEQRGIVSLTPAPIGPDIDVTLIGPLRPSESYRVTGANRIRSDLWDAFVHWDSGVKRFWNDRTMAVVEVHDNLTVDAKAMSGYVLIHPVAPEQVKAWMSDFAEQLPATMKTALLHSLENPLPFRVFRETADELRQTREWRRYFQTKIGGIIGDWAKENNLHVKIYQTGSAWRTGTLDISRHAQPEEAVRELVQGFIRNMTLPELLAVPIPMRLLAC